MKYTKHVLIFILIVFIVGFTINANLAFKIKPAPLFSTVYISKKEEEKIKYYICTELEKKLFKDNDNGGVVVTLLEPSDGGDEILFEANIYSYTIDQLYDYCIGIDDFAYMYDYIERLTDNVSQHDLIYSSRHGDIEISSRKSNVITGMKHEYKLETRNEYDGYTRKYLLVDGKEVCNYISGYPKKEYNLPDTKQKRSYSSNYSYGYNKEDYYDVDDFYDDTYGDFDSYEDAADYYYEYIE